MIKNVEEKGATRKRKGGGEKRTVSGRKQFSRRVGLNCFDDVAVNEFNWRHGRVFLSPSGRGRCSMREKMEKEKNRGQAIGSNVVGAAR